MSKRANKPCVDFAPDSLAPIKEDRRICTNCFYHWSAHWYRTCQECGHKQVDSKPLLGISDAYRDRKCKQCKSPALDFGTHPSLGDIDANT